MKLWNPQPSPKTMLINNIITLMDAVQRLNVGGEIEFYSKFYFHITYVNNFIINTDELKMHFASFEDLEEI